MLTSRQLNFKVADSLNKSNKNHTAVNVLNVMGEELPARSMRAPCAVAEELAHQAFGRQRLRWRARALGHSCACAGLYRRRLATVNSTRDAAFLRAEKEFLAFVNATVELRYD